MHHVRVFCSWPCSRDICLQGKARADLLQQREIQAGDALATTKRMVDQLDQALEAASASLDISATGSALEAFYQQLEGLAASLKDEPTTVEGVPGAYELYLQQTRRQRATVSSLRQGLGLLLTYVPKLTSTPDHDATVQHLLQEWGDLMDLDYVAVLGYRFGWSEACWHAYEAALGETCKRTCTQLDGSLMQSSPDAALARVAKEVRPSQA